MKLPANWPALPAALIGAGIAVWLLWPAEPVAPPPGEQPAAAPRVARRAASEPTAPIAPLAQPTVRATGVPRDSAAPPPVEPTPETEPGHDHANVEDPTGDLVWYEDNPMSEIPHEVVRGWGARGAGKVPGAVGVFVIVDPGISDEALEQLARDIRDFHYDANSLSVRILDSEHAATYDRHDDGGALAAEHLVGLVNRNEVLETDTLTIRGRDVNADDR